MVPKRLVRSIRSERCLLFVGAGLSKAAGCPGWPELTELLAKEIEAEGLSLHSFRERPNEQVLQLYSERFGVKRLQRALRAELTRRDVKPTEAHRLLAEMPFTKVVTTNWEGLLETALRNAGKHVAVIRSERDFGRTGGADVLVVKLHGDIEEPSSLIATESDYLAFQTEHPLLSAWIASSALENDFLFLGYSFSDFHLKSIVPYLGRKNHSSGRLFALRVEPDEAEVNYLRSLGVTPIKAAVPRRGSLADRALRFVKELHAETHLTGRHPDTILSLLLRENKLYLASLRRSVQENPPIIRNQSNMAVFGSPPPDRSRPLFTGKWQRSDVASVLDGLERELFDCWMKAIDRGASVRAIISLLPEAYAKYSKDQVLRRLRHFRQLLTADLWDNPRMAIIVKDATIERKVTIFDSRVLVIIDRGVTPLPVAASCRVTLQKAQIYDAIDRFDGEFREVMSLNLTAARETGIEGIDAHETLRKYTLHRLDRLAQLVQGRPAAADSVGQS